MMQTKRPARRSVGIGGQKFLSGHGASESQHAESCAGPPKQFAQAVGLAFTTAALVLTFGFGLPTAGTAVLAVLAVFAGLEAFAGFCMGCFVFAYLMRWGLVPEGTCLRCANLSFVADPGA